MWTPPPPPIGLAPTALLCPSCYVFQCRFHFIYFEIIRFLSAGTPSISFISGSFTAAETGKDVLLQL